MTTDPKYTQIQLSIRGQLASSVIKPGDKLPSIREMAEQLGCSKNTVIRAYDDLEKEHLIYSVPKSGYYAVVRADQPDDSLTGGIDFSSAAPDPAVMPFDDFRHCLNRAIDLYQDRLF